ncbi:unnamed protein product [Rhodiola kirilowii]
MRCLWPVLLDKLKEEIGTRFLLSGKVISCSCSHIGGHRYAGNLMVYGTDPSGKVTGHWYGYVRCPCIDGFSYWEGRDHRKALEVAY